MLITAFLARPIISVKLSADWISQFTIIGIIKWSLYSSFDTIEPVSFFASIRTVDLVNNLRLRYYADRWGPQKRPVRSSREKQSKGAALCRRIRRAALWSCTQLPPPAREETHFPTPLTQPAHLLSRDHAFIFRRWLSFSRSSLVLRLSFDCVDALVLLLLYALTRLYYPCCEYFRRLYD